MIVRLMTVCHKWHDTLVHTAHLWSLVDHHQYTKQPTTHAHYLYRNPTGPLFVYLNHPDPDPLSEPECDYGLLALLLEVGSRVEELRVSHMSGDLLSFQADRLLACTLRYVGGCGTPTRELFGGHSPRLRALELTGVRFLPSNTFPSLTHLIIAHDANYPFGSFPRADLLAVLSGCPSLKYVRLTVGVPFNGNTSTPHTIPEPPESSSHSSTGWWSKKGTWTAPNDPLQRYSPVSSSRPDV